MPTTGSPLGSTPFGLGTPVAAPVPPADPPSFSRYINPGTRSFEIDTSTGHFKSMPALRQRALIILMTVHGSSSVLRELGVRRVDKVSPDSLARLRTNVRDALAQLTTVERVMRIDGLVVDEVSPGRVMVLLSYTDLTTGRRDSVSAPIL